jgi:hypothetical protein
MTTPTSDKKTATSGDEMASAESIAAQEPFERRLKMILKCADQALAKVNAFEANLELVSTDLMLIILWLREDVEQARAAVANPLDRLGLTLPVSEQLYKNSKMLHGYADILMRLKKTRMEAKPRRAKVVVPMKRKPK